MSVSCGPSAFAWPVPLLMAPSAQDSRARLLLLQAFQIYQQGERFFHAPLDPSTDLVGGAIWVVLGDIG
jgi:hypothetical protein